MHEIAIFLIIAIIVGFQIKVFLETAKKINRFRQIIPEAENFETIKVYVPESQIKEIKIDFILNNLDKFQNPALTNKMIDTDILDFEDDFVDNYLVDEIVNEVHSEQIIDSSPIWIYKGNKEKKIESGLLKRYETLGWNRIQ